MFYTVILLTGSAEHVALAAALHGHRPQLIIHCATTPEDLAALEPASLSRARLIAFATPVIVPPHVLDTLGYGAYNFHPGPPQYPGWAPAHFALYEQASEFGATVHAMAERVDSGPIVDAALFPIPPGIGVLCDIPLDITKEELDRRLRVFGGNHWGMLPTIRLHGVTFRAVI
jgi:methionyl-tRNA formyltransferase